MALRYSTSNIHNKLGDLTLDSLPEQQAQVLPDCDMALSTKSLLSKSLAGEQYQPAQLQPMLMDELTRNLTDEHPEPELLATSVGKDSDGRLIPLSSTISLLSLSNNTTGGAPTLLELVLFVKQQQPQLQLQQLQAAQPPVAPVMDRKNSHNNMRSRNSLTHLHQQRLQPYQKLTLPTPPAHSEFTTFATPQSIPVPRQQGIMTPDSPNLDPTSVGGSPSRFWLSSQTPPRSLLNSFSKSRTHMFPHTHGLHGAHAAHSAHGSHGHQQHAYSTVVGSTHAVSGAINIATSGGDSPVLNPVQTPLEECPMTPLFLNGGGDNYFVLTNGPGLHPERDYRGFEVLEYDEMAEIENESDHDNDNLDRSMDDLH